MIVCLGSNVTTERRRLALVGLCVLAVALGAALFPTAGFGSVPGERAGDSPGAGPDGDSDGPAGPTSTATPTDRRTPVSDRFDDPTPTATPTPTPTATPTDVVDDQPPPDYADDPPAGPLGWLVDNALLIAGLGVVAALGLLAARVFGGFGDRWLDGDGGAGPGETGPLGLLFSPVRLGKRISQGTMVALVGFSTMTARALTVAGRVAGTVGSVVGALMPRGGSADRPSLADVLGAVTVPFAALSAVSLSAVPGVLDAVTASGTAESASPQRTDGRVAAPVDPTDGEEDGDVGPATVTEAWEVLTEAVRVDDHDSTTPTEYARAAVRQGLPAEPVARLAKSFRRVRYGDRRPTADQTAAAVEAADRIRSALADADEDAETPDADGGDSSDMDGGDGSDADGGDDSEGGSSGGVA